MISLNDSINNVVIVFFINWKEDTHIQGGDIDISDDIEVSMCKFVKSGE